MQVDTLSPSDEIDAIIKKSNDWRGKKLAQLRVVIQQTNPQIIEEVKWKKPSKPEGVPVWSYNGLLCVGEMLKNAVRLTFPKGAQIKDPQKMFNTRIDSKTVRAIDFFENSTVNEKALETLIREAAKINTQKE